MAAVKKKVTMVQVKVFYIEDVVTLSHTSELVLYVHVVSLTR